MFRLASRSGRRLAGFVVAAVALGGLAACAPPPAPPKPTPAVGVPVQYRDLKAGDCVRILDWDAVGKSWPNGANIDAMDGWVARVPCSEPHHRYVLRNAFTRVQDGFPSDQVSPILQDMTGGSPGWICQKFNNIETAIALGREYYQYIGWAWPGEPTSRELWTGVPRP